jgi:hypothetical protein
MTVRHIRCSVGQFVFRKDYNRPSCSASLRNVILCSVCVNHATDGVRKEYGSDNAL